MENHGRYVLLAAILLLQACKGAADPEAEKLFRASLGNTSITVYPTVIRMKTLSYDAASAAPLAGFLRDKKLAEPVLAKDEVPLASVWGRDESKMFRDSARDFGAFTKGKLTTPYALLPECLMGGEELVAVHYYVVDSEGRLAFGRGLNSHSKLFTAAPKKTPADCSALVAASIEEKLLPGK